MSKKPRRGYGDVLPATAPAQPAAAPPAAPAVPEPTPETTRSRENVATPRGFNVRKERVEKPHQSIYAHPLVFRELRKIAAAEEVKPQELYREGLREVFRRRGLDFDALDSGEEV